MRRATTSAARRRSTSDDGRAHDLDPAEEARRQRWIAETTAAFLEAGARNDDPDQVARRRAFRRAALEDSATPSRRDEWSRDLVHAFD